MKIFIVALLKHFKSFNNLLLNLSIKSVSSFSYIKLVMKYYSYFRYILEYFKAYRFYSIFKAFFKVIALINILLGLFTLIVFTEFRYNDYKQFIEYNITNFSFNNLIINFKSYIKRIFKKIIYLFDDDSIAIDTHKSDKLPNTYNLGKEGVKTDSYLPYYLFGLFTILICYKYPEYTVTPIISGITSFIWSFLGGDGQDDNPSDKPSDINPLDKGKGRAIIKSDIDHLTPSSNPEPSASTISRTSSSGSTRIFFDRYFPSFTPNLSDKTVALIGVDNDLLTDSEWSKSDSSSDSSSSSSSTVTQGSIASSSSSSTVTPGSTVTPIDTTMSTSGNSSSPSTPSRRKVFSPRWAPPKDGWK